MRPNGGISRRRALGLLGGSVGAVLLGSCSNPEDDEEVAAPGSGGVGAIQLPKSGAELPTGQVRLRWTESSQFSKAFLPTFWEAYKKEHSNVTVTYDNLPDADLAQVLQLAFQSNDVPDVFRLSGPVIPPAQVVGQQLVQPIDDLVPDFEAWKSAFPEGSFVEGLNVFGGKTYSFPMLGPFTETLKFNADYLDQAGFDPIAEPLTFDTFREAARKTTEQGSGRYYGLTLGGLDNGFTQFIGAMAALAGAEGGSFNYKTGTYNYASDGYAAVIELLLALKSDKSIDPSAVSIDQKQANAKLPVGQAAMIVSVMGDASQWIAENPDFKFGIGDLPVPTSGSGYVGVSPSTSFWWVAAESENGAVVGDIFSYLGSVDGQKAWQQVSGGSLPVAHPEANEVGSIDDRIRRAHEYFPKVVRILPEPSARNEDVSLVLQEMESITPALPEVIQGIYTGQLDDPKKEMADLQSRSERALDSAIAAAKAKGAKVSREDWVFSDWDPSKDYVQGS